MINASDSFKEAMNNSIAEVYWKFELLDKNLNVLDTITTDVSYDDIGDISVDSTRDIHRQVTIQLNNHSGKFVWNENALIWIDLKRVKIYVGLQTPNGIEYVCLGVFILSSPENNSSPTENSTTIVGSDLWYLLTDNFGKYTNITTYDAFEKDKDDNILYDDDNQPIYKTEKDKDGKTIYNSDGTPKLYKITNYIKSILENVGITKYIIDDCDSYLTTELTYQIGDNRGQAIKDLVAKCYSELDNYFYEAYFDVNGYFRFQKYMKPTEIAPVATYKIEDGTAYAGSTRSLDDSSLFNDIIVVGGSGDTAEFRTQLTVDEDAYETHQYGDSVKAEFNKGTHNNTEATALGKLGLREDKEWVILDDGTSKQGGAGTYAESGTFTSRWFDIHSDYTYKDGKISWIDASINKDSHPQVVKKTCTTCGYVFGGTTNSHIHEATNTFTHNATQHGYKCKYCDEIVNGENHTYGDWIIDDAGVTNVRNGKKHRICSVCGYVQNETIVVDHEPIYDGNLHPSRGNPKETHGYICQWEGCMNFQHIKKMEYEDQATDEKKYMYTLPHGYSNPTFYNMKLQEKHAIVRFTETPTILNPTGKAITKCVCCGYEYGEESVTLELTNHNSNKHTVAQNMWEYDKDYHWNPCMGTIENEDTFKEYIKTNLYRCAHYENKALHDYDEGTVIKAPTATDDGITRYTCKVCGYSYDEGVDCTSHTHTPSSNWLYDKDNHWHQCTHLDSNGKRCDNKVNKAPHTWGKETTVSEAFAGVKQEIKVQVQFADKNKNVIKTVDVQNDGNIGLKENESLPYYMRYIVKFTSNNKDYPCYISNLQIDITVNNKPWAGHPYSIQQIGRRTYLYNDGIDSNIDTMSQCVARADFELRKNLAYTEDVTVNVLPNYLFEENDVICIEDSNNGCKDNYQIESFSIPIKPKLMELKCKKIRRVIN